MEVLWRPPRRFDFAWVAVVFKLAADGRPQRPRGKGQSEKQEGYGLPA